MNPIEKLPVGLQHRLFNICAGFNITGEELLELMLKDAMAQQRSPEVQAMFERYAAEHGPVEGDLFPHIRTVVRNHSTEEYRSFTQSLYDYKAAFESKDTVAMDAFLKLAEVEPSEENYAMIANEVEAYISALDKI